MLHGRQCSRSYEVSLCQTRCPGTAACCTAARTMSHLPRTCLPLMSRGCTQSAWWGPARIPSSWSPSSPLVSGSPQVTMQGRKPRRVPAARVLRSTCRVVIQGHHPREPTTPLLRRRSLTRCGMRLPRPRLKELREVAARKSQVVRHSRAPLRPYLLGLLWLRRAPAVTSSASVAFVWTSRSSARGRDPPAAATSSGR